MSLTKQASGALTLILMMIGTCLDAQTEMSWLTISAGVDYAEVDAPEKSFLNDSKLSILRIEPDSCEFHLLCASQHQNALRTAPQWAEEFEMQVIVNAGMYELTDKLRGRYFMKNYNHYNNPDFNRSGNAMMAFNPIRETSAAFDVFDLTCKDWKCLKTDYNTFCQGMRMLDCDGNPLAWDKNPKQSCSMLVASIDSSGRVYFIFTRSPFTHASMIRFLKQLPFNLLTTIYLEGGPETSFYVNTPSHSIPKMGSYVYPTYQNDDNQQFWKIPNVIGIKGKLRVEESKSPEVR